MKYMRIAGFCLVALLLMSMAMAATASAAPHWEACEKGASGTKYTQGEHEQCETASGTGEWGWAEIKGTEKSAIRGTLTIKDETKLVTWEVECTVKGEGSFGPGKYSRIEKVSYECKEGKNCEKIVKTVEPKNLPWQDELSETEGKVQSTLSNGKTGKEALGWTVTCKVLGVESADEINFEKLGESVQNARSFFFLELLTLIDPFPSNSLICSLADLLAKGNGVRAS